jgi:hypothetical protein
MKIVGRITRVSEGTIEKGRNAGQDWQALTIEGLRLFVPLDMQNGFERGQLVKCDILHRGDKQLTADGRTLGYEAQFDLLAIEVIPEVQPEI